jgi:hypothetical protein
MISVRFTYDEAQALVDFIWGEDPTRRPCAPLTISSQPHWTRTQTPGRPASGSCKLNPGCLVSRSEVAVLWPARGWSGRSSLPS